MTAINPERLTYAEVRKAIAAGHVINPRVIEQLIEKLDTVESRAWRMEVERDGLATEMAKVEAAVSKMPKRSQYVARWAVGVIVGCSVLSGLGIGLFIGFAVGGG